ncbi:rod-binding protein [Thiospirochaeta perfilievii]|nr:rod-binding protein [Thiospirochaeta perfilievii]
MNNLNLDPNQIVGNSKAVNLQKSITNSKDDQKLKESCKEFEAMFIKQMLSSMKKTVNKSGLIKENMGEKIFDDMLSDEYSKSMAQTSSFGIADMMYKQLAVQKYQ